MRIQGQGHSLILVTVIQMCKIKTFFFSETTGPFVTKFPRKAFSNKEMKISKCGIGHMSNVAAMPVYGKII